MGSLTHREHFSSHTPTFRELLRVFLIREIGFFSGCSRCETSELSACTHPSGQRGKQPLKLETGPRPCTRQPPPAAFPPDSRQRAFYSVPPDSDMRRPATPHSLARILNTENLDL